MIPMIKKTAKRIEKEFRKPTLFLIVGFLLSCHLIYRFFIPFLDLFDEFNLIFILSGGLLLLLGYIGLLIITVIIPVFLITIIIIIDRMLINYNVFNLKILSLIEGVLLLIAWGVLEYYDLTEGIVDILFD